MTLRESLRDIQDSVGSAGTNAPDEYSGWSSISFEKHMADLKELWNSIESRLADRARAKQVGSDLREMISAFERGDKDAGRKLAWKLYNDDFTNLL